MSEGNLVLKSLTKEVEQAQNRYNNAESDHVSIATYELLAAEERLNQYIKEQKKGPQERQFQKSQ